MTISLFQSATHCSTILYWTSLPQHPVVVGYDGIPTDEEFSHATLKLKNKTPDDSGTCGGASMERSTQRLSNIRNTKKMSLSIWDNEQVPDEWNIGRLMCTTKER